MDIKAFWDAVMRQDKHIGTTIGRTKQLTENGY